jgi:16S rRNA processing protein RimM
VAGDKPSSRVLLGRIAGAHGIRGEVLIKSFAAVPENINTYGPLSTEDGSRAFEIASARSTAKGVVARLVGIYDRNAAEALRGTDLYVARDRLPPATDDEYYHADLIGMTAVTPDDAALGEIVAVHNFGAGDLIEIRLAGKAKTELFPFTDAVVPEVDVAARRVTIVPPPDNDKDR